jgi:hypothetical protein
VFVQFPNQSSLEFPQLEKVKVNIVMLPKTSMQRKMLELFELNVDGNDEIILQAIMNAVVQKVTSCRLTTKLVKENNDRFVKQVADLKKDKQVLLNTNNSLVGQASIAEGNVQKLAADLTVMRVRVDGLLEERGRHTAELELLRAQNAGWAATNAALNKQLCETSAQLNSSRETLNESSESMI